MSQVSVRYIVHDMDETIAFYTELLRLRGRHAPGPRLRRTQAAVTSGSCSTRRPVPEARPSRCLDGRRPEPGGWNRILLYRGVTSSADAKALRGLGVTLRSDVIEGQGGRQVLVDDPSGNPGRAVRASPERLITSTRVPAPFSTATGSRTVRPGTLNAPGGGGRPRSPTPRSTQNSLPSGSVRVTQPDPSVAVVADERWRRRRRRSRRARRGCPARGRGRGGDGSWRSCPPAPG